MTDPLTTAAITSKIADVGYAKLPIQDDKLAWVVLLVGCMLAVAIWGAAQVIADAIRERK
jgi:uncharacterized membrane protein